jgi:predicted site-specific integrase-resolvase
MLDRSQLLTREELAERLGVDVKTVDRWCRVGVRGVLLPRRFIGGRVFFSPEDIHEWQAAVNKARNRKMDVPTLREQKASLKKSREVFARLGMKF